MNPEVINRTTQAVLFDLDGTLIDTAPDLHRSINQLLIAQGLAEVSYGRIRHVASNGALAMLKAALELHNSPMQAESLIEDFLTLYRDDPASSGGLFKGTQALIDWLDQREIPWGIVTNKPRDLSEKVLVALDLDTRCATLICPEDVAQPKPHPEGLWLAAQQLKCQPESCFYLGDHRRDIEAGQAAGMTTVACGFGYLADDESHLDWGANFSVSDDGDLVNLLDTLLSQSDNP